MTQRVKRGLAGVLSLQSGDMEGDLLGGREGDVAADAGASCAIEDEASRGDASAMAVQLGAGSASSPEDGLVAKHRSAPVSSASASARGAKRPKNSGGLKLKDAALVVGLAVCLVWGAWVTKSLLYDGMGKDRFVKLQLQGVIAEYLQAQARSGSDDRTAAQQTAQFMAVLDKAVAAAGQDGRIVLVNEAIVGGDIPDITAQVKSEVYAQVPMPKVAAITPVQQGMESFMASNGGHGDDRHRQ